MNLYVILIKGLRGYIFKKRIFIEYTSAKYGNTYCVVLMNY